MYWYIWWGISVVIFLATLIDAFVLSKLKYKRKRLLTPNKMLIMGTFLSATILLCPIYLEKFSDSISWVEWGKSLLLSMQHAIRLFTFEGDFMEFFSVETIQNLTPRVQMLYTGASAVLYVFAPFLTFGLILSFFKNVSSYRRYLVSFWKKTHVFSELNEKSLVLAKSINETYVKNEAENKKGFKFLRKPLIVFTDVVGKDDENTLALIEEAKEMGAILFTKDLESIRYRNRYLSIRKVNFYLISDDEEEKIRHAESIITDYKFIKHTKLFLFSNNIESKSFLESYTENDKKGMCLEVIRVNDIRALIYHNLNDNGIHLFENANDLSDGRREISAVIVGLGQYGMEMLKALLWYSQLPNYRVTITAFDDREEARSTFEAACPEIKIDEAIDEEGDMRYTLHIKKAKYGTKEFYDAIMDLNEWKIENGTKEISKQITYLFVCLGNDRDNIAAAKGIRNWLAHGNVFPYIETVVYDSALKNRLFDEFSKQNINIIGDLAGFYSEGTVINSGLTNDGLDVHTRWDNSENTNHNYYMNDYNYYSSLAGALHRNLRKTLVQYDKIDKIFPFYSKYNSEEKALFQKINNNTEIKELSNEMTEFADYLYIKLAHVHYKELKVEERKKVLDILKDYMSKDNISLNIPMLGDTNAYLEGYELFIQNFDSENKKKVMRMLFNAIIEMKTSDIQDEAERRQLIHSLEYDRLSKESDKLLICEYVKQHMGQDDNDAFNMKDYFDKGRQFAQIEHIRWNAYVRTEGFRRAGNPDKKYRKYQMHYDIVPVELLTFADCIKDI